MINGMQVFDKHLDLSMPTRPFTWLQRQAELDIKQPEIGGARGDEALLPFTETKFAILDEAPKGYSDASI